MTIPIRNLYYIFCYAWEYFPAGETTDVGEDECPDLKNLFAKLLIDGLHRLIRRDLDRGYVEAVEDTRLCRGRLLLDPMIKRQTLSQGVAVCQFDEFRTDILHNQILKATARLLANTDGVLREYQHELRLMVRKFEPVSDIHLSGSAFRRVQLTRNNRQYRMLMQLCEFVFFSVLPKENGSGARFADVLDDEVRMSAIFEEFLRNFYAHEQTIYSVKREVMSWDASEMTEVDRFLLPHLQTDITLHSADRVIIFEAKYYKDPLEGRRGFARKLRSDHLRQLFTYLYHTSLKSRGKRVDGVLIYPTVGNELRAEYLIAGHGVRVLTIGLDRPWQAIHSELLGIPGAAFPGGRNNVSGAEPAPFAIGLQ